MILTQVTPPSEKVVATADLCAWLRATDPGEMAIVESLEAAAVTYLDGWTGILGRAIRTQVWRQEFCGWGDLLLAMPDVSAITVTALDAGGAAVVATRAELRASALGPYVITEGPSVDRVFVQFTAALPVARLPAAQTVVKLMVANWFMNREAVTEGAMTELPWGAASLIDALRWRSI